ncbi:MAG TPA: universal stress protein [Beutenbergiaceae bacterium]|nr:universal stress protein [Beutenbergiaceae bacterium]
MAIVTGFLPTPAGRAALQHAEREAKRLDAKLVIVNSYEDDRDWNARDGREVEEELEEIRRRLNAAGVQNELRTLVRGNTPAEDLLEVADDEDARYIVIGLRRRTPVGKLILGSNAQQILLDSNRPVISVKPDESN